MAAVVSAATNLFDASTATLTSWFGDGNWAELTTSTATYDAATGTITCNIHQASYGQWHAQIKLQTAGITLDEAKNYEFKCTFNANNAVNNVTVKVFDDSELSYKADLALAAGNTDYTTAAFKGGSVGNGVIVFDLGFAVEGDVVTISNIVLQETTAAVVEDPKPTTAPDAPTADAATVLSIYSNSYPAAAAFGFCEGWGQTTSLEELNLDGNHVLYYKNFNYLGWSTATPIDASTCTGLHMDIWAPEAGSLRVFPIYGGAGLTTDDSKFKVVNLAEGWNSVDFNLATDFAGLDLSSIFQFKFDQGTAQQYAIDNVYFSGYTAPAVTYTSLAEVYTHSKGDTVVLKDFEVTYAPAADTRYYYIKDATASGLIFLKNYGLAAGDKVAKGMVAKVDIFNGLYELIPVTPKAELTITPGTPAQPALATSAPTAADQNKYVVYKNVTVAADTAFLASTKNTVFGIIPTSRDKSGNDTILFYNSFKIAATLEAGKQYTIEAVNSVYNNPQALPIAVTEQVPTEDECAGEHGLYDPAKALINSTYFATEGWGANPGCNADISNGVISIHVDKAFVDMWQGQVFVDPGFTFEAGKAYHYEFDIVSTGKVCMTVKVNDSDEAPFFMKAVYDLNIGGGTYHFSTDSVFANENLATGKGPLVFGFGWTDANNDITIQCIKITELGEAPEPEEEHMYIKHPWGTGKDTDWAWKEMTQTKYNAVDAWTATGAWGGVGFNIADNEEGKDAKWFAADAIQFLNKDGIVVTAPAVGTENCQFLYIPMFDAEGAIAKPAVVIVPTAEGIEHTEVNAKVTKTIRNGQLVIMRGGVEYNVLGAQL
ncbi:MAG: hypothetical protein ACI4UO_05720, partial [Paludibacteraceae bacterium]